MNAEHMTSSEVAEALGLGAERDQPAKANPYVKVTLNSAGLPCLVLSHASGPETLVPLYDLDALIGVLEGQMAGRIALGLDGSPTQAQAWHQAKHGTFPDERCAFCIASRVGKAAAELAANARPARRYLADGVVVTRIPLGTTSLGENRNSKGELERRKGPANRFDVMPLGLQPHEARKWRAEKAEWEKGKTRKAEAKQGRYSWLKAEKLGL